MIVRLTKAYLYIQIALNFFMLFYLLIVDKKNIQYSIFFLILSGMLFFLQGSSATYIISKYLKDNYKDLYIRNMGTRKYIFKDLVAINIFSLKKADIKIIDEYKITKLINNLRLSYKVFFISLIIDFSVLVFFAYQR